MHIKYNNNKQTQRRIYILLSEKKVENRTEQFKSIKVREWENQ